MRLDQLPVGLATGSMGMHPNHTLEQKLSAIHQVGMRTCEIRFGNYEQWVRSRCPGLPASSARADWAEDGEPDPEDDEIWEALFDHAPVLLKLVESLSIQILMIQPMDNFGGWPSGSERGEWAKRKAVRWVELCSRLQVQQLQVGSNCHEAADGSDEQVASELRWLADVASQQNPPVKIAYEPLPFAHRINSWEHGWNLVQLADHTNLGLCLDTALVALTPSYGCDPTTGEGYADGDFDEMIARLRRVPASKLFYVELSELLRPIPSLGKGSQFDAWREINKPAHGDRFTWCVCARPVAGVLDEGQAGIARVSQVLSVLLHMGYTGPLMFESFEALEMQKPDEGVPLRYAKKYAEGWENLKAAVKIPLV